MNQRDFLTRIRGWRLFAGLSALLLTTVAFAQQAPIGGVVRDAQGPLAGVMVSVQGTTTGAFTDPDGRYTIHAAPDATLEFRFLGFLSRTVAVGGRTSVDVTLEEDITGLDEVVAIGYGIMRRADLTGAVSSVGHDDIVLSPVTNTMEALQGKIAGMDISLSSGAAGAGVNVLLRGTRSIDGDNKPLYVIDGIPGSIDNLNPNDIETIDVLKDAASTAIYGSSGANGVVIVTTKRAKTGQVQVDFDAFYGINGFASYPAPLQGNKLIEYKNEAFYTSNGYYPSSLLELGLALPVVEAIERGQWVDWVDEVMGIGAQQNYAVSIRGGTEKLSGTLSGGYMSEKGIYQNDKKDTYTLRAVVDNQIKPWLKAGVQAALAWSDHDRTNSRVNKAYSFWPLGKPYNDDGTINLYPVVGSGDISPLANYAPGVYLNNRKSMNTRVTPYIEITPLAGLTIKSVFNASLSSTRSGTFENERSYNNLAAQLDVKKASYTTAFDYDYTWENIINYNFDVKDHAFGVTGITSWADNRSEEISMTGEGLDYDEFVYYNMQGADILTSYDTDYKGSKRLSFAGRVNYDYKGKYLLNLSNRWDGSSQLAQRWDMFPAVGVAWRMSDENFMAGTRDWLSNLKLRLSYGVTGNSNIGAYNTKTEVTTAPESMTLGGSSRLPLYILTEAAGNPELRWEKSYSTNIGLDATLFKGRVDVVLEWYDTHTDGVLYKRKLPFSSGGFNAKTPYKMSSNIAETSNRGFEATINTVNVRNGDFLWESTFTFAANREKLLSIDLGNVSPDELISENLFVGEAIKPIYGLKKTGIWQLGEEEEAALYGREPGHIKLRTVEQFDAEGVGDGGIHPYDVNKDRMILGSARPAWTLGFQNSFRYKNFDLNVMINMRWGQMLSAQMLGYWSSNGATIPENYDYWTPNNPTNDFPRPGLSSDDVTTTALQYVDGSHLKVKNLTLGYTLPGRLQQKLGLSRLRVYATAYNPIVITKSSMLKGVDPEAGGADTFPLYKRIVFGVNVSF